MKTINYIEVAGQELIAELEAFAFSLWREHYIPFIGREQVEYMINLFQSREAITRQIEQEGYLYYLFTDADGLRAGYMGIVPQSSELFLSKLYIARSHQNKGYGRRAVELAQIKAREYGLSRITLTVNKQNTGSIDAYKKLGFVITDLICMDIGSGFFMDDFRMEKVVL
ncbi:MAG: GNAT family N-acetyltransferase [Candidatus Omnitrophota bacterium]